MNTDEVRAFSKRTLPKIYRDQMLARAYRECGTGTSQAYFRDAFAKAQFVILTLKPRDALNYRLIRTRSLKGELAISGFMLLYEIPSKNCLFVDLVCTGHRNGKKLFERAEKLTKQRKREHLLLHAIDNERLTSRYYTAYGFRYVPSEKHKSSACQVGTGYKKTKMKINRNNGDTETLWPMSKCMLKKKSKG